MSGLVSLPTDCLAARESCSRGDAMASEQEKIAYLEEHISYELVMLNYTFMRLVTSRPSTPEEQLDCNAFLESFGVHARNLADFLSARPRENCRNVSDYITDFEAPAPTRVEQALSKLEKQVLHVTSLRATDLHEKFNAGDARELYAWIVPAVLKFQGQLLPTYRDSLDALGPIEASMQVRFPGAD
jgi:hypothetical protein